MPSSATPIKPCGILPDIDMSIEKKETKIPFEPFGIVLKIKWPVVVAAVVGSYARPLQRLQRIIVISSHCANASDHLEYDVRPTKVCVALRSSD